MLCSGFALNSTECGFEINSAGDRRISPNLPSTEPTWFTTRQVAHTLSTGFTVFPPIPEGEHSLSKEDLALRVTTVTEMRKISRKQYLECLRLRGSDRLNETFKAVCLNPVENTLGFLEDAQRLAMTQHLKTSSLLLCREMPVSHSRETGPCGRAQMGTWVPWPVTSHSQRGRACH